MQRRQRRSAGSASRTDRCVSERPTTADQRQIIAS